MITTASGLQYEDTVIGSGEAAQAGHHVTVHYTGWMHDPDAPQSRGPKFDSSTRVLTIPPARAAWILSPTR